MDKYFIDAVPANLPKIYIGIEEHRRQYAASQNALHILIKNMQQCWQEMSHERRRVHAVGSASPVRQRTDGTADVD